MSDRAGSSNGLAARFIGTAFVIILHFWSWTLRKDTTALSALDAMLADGKRVLAVFWHGKYFPLFFLASGYRAHVLIAPSFRGQVIAQICRSFGYTPVFTSAAGHGVGAIKQALDGEVRLLALALDGPVGPHHDAKHGAVRIASDLGFHVLPMEVRCSRSLVLSKRWDKREIPWPFSRVQLILGDPIKINAPLSHDDLDRRTSALKQELEAIAES